MRDNVLGHESLYKLPQIMPHPVVVEQKIYSVVCSDPAKEAPTDE